MIHEDRMVENFFHIWLLKGFIFESKFDSYLFDLLDENEKFDVNKLKSILDEIYEKISLNNMTTYRPSNIKSLDKEDISEILESDEQMGGSFFNDIRTHLEHRVFSLKYEGLIDDMDKRKIRLLKIKNGIKAYLESLYSNDVYQLYTKDSMSDIVKKTVEHFNRLSEKTV